ncbi:hypothetical protein [Haladaptatus sp. DYF46]|uniref:DUF7522 family protein n=1 Tax=Haladaptatus sp. DYF46 TaxID=2886041 RepID=UPI001E323354|nr:hypothetical protein [Haladaptatus sp. DYF46]
MKTKALTDALRDAVGDGLRTVATGNIEEKSFDIVYMREDIGSLYSEEEREEILHDLVLENLVEVRQERLFAPLGDLQLTSRVFEYGINVVGWNENAGVFVGLDPDETLIPTTIRACRSAFD